MTKLTREEILALARLAKLELTEDEVLEFSNELGAILSYVQQLQDVDTQGLPLTSQVTGLNNVMRPDVITDYGIERTKLMQNIPSKEGDYIKVKRVI